jgi:hypothetical protein
MTPARTWTGGERWIVQRIRLAALMRRYRGSRDPAVAGAVAGQLRRMLDEPASPIAAHERCVVHCLEARWRWLSEQRPRRRDNDQWWPLQPPVTSTRNQPGA